MRNLLLFVWKYHFTFLFILLEVIAVLLLSTNNTYQRTRMHSLTLGISGTVYGWQENLAGYVNLSKENEVLRRQNALLENELYERFGSKRTKTVIGEYEVQPAVVVNSTFNQGNNYVIINAGRKQGVFAKMGVKGPDGVVGVVTHASDQYAAIMPLIHSQSRLSCQLQKNAYFGLLRWEGTDHRMAVLQNIANHVEIDSGDIVITRGGTGIFPKGIPVGHAIGSEKNQSTGFQTIYVSLSTNFENLNTAYVIQNKLQPELDSLINEVRPDE